LNTEEKRMNLQGKITEIFDTQQISDRFSKREFVIEYAENPQYPQFVKFELTQDKCDMLDQYKVGDEVDVHFNVRGRAWTNPKGQTQYFNTLQAWRLDVASAQAANAAPGAPGMATGGGGNAAPAQPSWMTAEDNDRKSGSSFSSQEEDDLPF
jgi:hypothetical protein